MHRTALIAALVLSAGCAAPRPASAAPAPAAPAPPPAAALPAVPAPAAAQPSAPTPAAAPARAPAAASAGVLSPPVAAQSVHAADGWAVAFSLDLPALPAAIAAPVRRLCEGWLFQGLVAPEGDFDGAARAALALLVRDSPAPAGAAGAFYCRRAIRARHHDLGWLSLERTWEEAAGGAASLRTEGIIVDLDGIRPLPLDEIVDAERQGALRRLLATALRRQLGLPDAAPITSAVADDTALPVPVPVLTGSGAVFVWNAFEIAEGDRGAFRVELPADALRGLLVRDPWPR